jgi:hypothetical protein
VADVDIGSMAEMATTLIRTPLEASKLEQLSAALLPLLADIDRLRALPLKDCEPSFIFKPVET